MKKNITKTLFLSAIFTLISPIVQAKSFKMSYSFRVKSSVITYKPLAHKTDTFSMDTQYTSAVQSFNGNGPFEARSQNLTPITNTSVFGKNGLAGFALLSIEPGANSNQVKLIYETNSGTKNSAFVVKIGQFEKGNWEIYLKGEDVVISMTEPSKIADQKRAEQWWSSVLKRVGKQGIDIVATDLDGSNTAADILYIDQVIQNTITHNSISFEGKTTIEGRRHTGFTESKSLAHGEGRLTIDVSGSIKASSL